MWNQKKNKQTTGWFNIVDTTAKHENSLTGEI